ncbi:hypothetical protein OJAV_G00236490, partial [Oryzias javanicus]
SLMEVVQSWPLSASRAVYQVFDLTPSVPSKLLCSILTAMLLSLNHWNNRAVPPPPPLRLIPMQQKQHSLYQTFLALWTQVSV